LKEAMIRPNSPDLNPTHSKTGSIAPANDIPFDVNVGSVATEESTVSEQVIHVIETESMAAPFVSQWNRLVSQTNWEKGAIIIHWRNELIQAQAHPTQFSDEAWARSVDGVSAQHVGRLRRVYERFKDSYSSYQGLYWTHFLAAMDWSDAELWLEGASQSKWSVSEMRRTRWESTGKLAQDDPTSNPVAAAEADEDYTPLVEDEEDVEVDREPSDRIGTDGPLNEGPDFGEGESDGEVAVAEEYEDVEAPEAVEYSGSNPFADLPSLPDDLSEAMEQFKLAIVRHRLAEWSEVTPAVVQRVLDALGEFARSGG
jgi:hypothetical protein